MPRPPVKANQVADWDDLKNPGDFLWSRSSSDDPARILFICPCGCGDHTGVPVRPESTPGPVWTWDGNRDAPTLTPSLQRVGGCNWHGFLTAGEFREC